MFVMCNLSSILNLFVAFKYMDGVFEIKCMVFDTYMMTSKSLKYTYEGKLR